MGWLTGWSYRKSHTINGSSSGAVTNYQVRIKVYYGSGTDSGESVYLNSKCRTDFGDVRFTSSDGETLLDYWIEEKVDSNYAIFWVEVDSIPASPDTKTIYIYYGKSDATSISDGDATFIFFDDFETDLSKWTVNNAELSTDYAYEGSKSVKISTSNSNIEKHPDWSDVSVHVKYYERKTGNKEKHILGCDATSATLIGVDEDQNSSYYIYRIGSSYYSSGIERSVGWHEFCIRCTTGKKQFLIDGELLSQEGTENSITWLWLGSHWTANAEVSYWDACFVRKYVDPEPSHGGWGTEEALEFYIKEVEAIPSRVIRTGAYTTQLKVSFYDSENLDPSNYTVRFYLRDPNETIKGPYIGTVVRISTNNYEGTYNLDPPDSWILGKYDLKVEVLK